MKPNSFKTFIAAESGVAAIEFCFIFPIMLFLFFCLVDFTSYVSFNRKTAAISGAIADLVSKNRNNVYKDDIQQYFSITGMIMKPFPANMVKVKVFGYRNDGTNVVRRWVVENTSSVTCPAEPSTSSMASLMVAGNDLVVAQTCMLYTPLIGTFMFQGAGQNYDTTMGAADFVVEEIVTQRPRSSVTLNCFVTNGSSTAC